MLIIGLTGSIGMGKSAAAAGFTKLGIPVFDADAEVHALYAGPLAADIERAFPGTTAKGAVDRTKLSAALLAAPHRFKELEAIVHPRVRASERAFVQSAHHAGQRLVVLEIPLLFESKAQATVDVVVVVSAPVEIQRRRVLARPGMTPAKLDAILARQFSDADKRRAAYFVVDTSGSVEACHAQIAALVAKLKTRAGHAYDRHWR